LRLLIAFLCLLGWGLQAQELDLPASEQFTAALSDQYTRTDTLLTMIAIARLLEYGASAELADIDALASRFRDERAWLDYLAGRYLDLPMRGSHLDPAAWFVAFELARRQVLPATDVRTGISAAHPSRPCAPFARVVCDRPRGGSRMQDRP
jgi:hypothetical protein